MSADIIPLKNKAASHIALAEQYLAARGVGLKQAEVSGIVAVPNAKDILPGFKKRPALLIEYQQLPTGEDPVFDQDGEQFGFARVRYLGEEPKSFVKPKKAERFAQPAGSDVFAFFPQCAGLSWKEVLDDKERPVIIVEGEIKALAGCLQGFAVVAIGGVNNIHRRSGAFLPELAAVANARPMILCFDSDLADNPAVLRAERVLADELRRHGATSVCGVRLPTSKAGDKQGLDDFLLASGADEFERLVGEAQEIDSSLLAICVSPHRLNENLETLDLAIACSGEHAYQRGGELIYVDKADRADTEGAVSRAEGAPMIRQLSALSCQQLAMRVARFEKWDGRKKAHIPAECPASLAAHYLQKLKGWNLPELKGIVEAPTLRPDGSVLQEPGFDEATGVLYIPSAEFPRINTRPDKRQALAALETLLRVVRGLEFANDESKAVWAAAVITSLVRKAIPTAPMFGISATQPGTGKTLAANLVGIVATGHKPTTISQGGSLEEDRKRLFAALLAGDPVVSIDNCDLPVEGAALCTVLTSQAWSERLLGQSKNVTVAANLTFLATGNKLVFGGDMCRRAVLCTLTSSHDRPAERRFGWSAEDEALADRPALVEAALTIVLAYMAAGEPAVKASPFGSFEGWQRFVQKPLLWLGAPDPCGTLKDVEANDPDRQEFDQLLHLWTSVFGDRVVKVRDFLDLGGGGLKVAKGEKEQRTALFELARNISGSPANGDFNTKAFGKYLLANEGKPVNGRRLVRGQDAKLKVATWRVV